MTPTFLLREAPVLTSLVLSVAFASPPLQDPPPEPAAEAPVEAGASRSATTEALRSRIHGMRMDLLLGGEKVRAAEDEASSFYRGKLDLVDQTLDSVSADLAEKRASYQVKLQSSLKASSPEDRRRTLLEAASLRTEITGLEADADGLEDKRGKLNELIGAIDDRDRERQKLAARIEASDSIDFDLGLPLASVGLAPDLPPAPPQSPLANEALVADLLAVDPRGGRQVLFEMDPSGYWEVFPLRPPSDAVVAAFGFPLPDLEGSR